MKLTETTFKDTNPVEGYGPGFFRIGGEIYQGPVLTGPQGTAGWGGYDDHAPLLSLAGHVDVLLLGTGAEMAHIPDDLRQVLESAGIGVEAMASGAAARTYNVLLGEGRRVALAMLPV